MPRSSHMESCNCRWVSVFLSLLVSLVLISAMPAVAVDRYVPSSYPTIQAAIDVAQDGDTVLVADGTYTGDGNRDIDFAAKQLP